MGESDAYIFNKESCAFAALGKVGPCRVLGFAFRFGWTSVFLGRGGWPVSCVIESEKEPVPSSAHTPVPGLWFGSPQVYLAIRWLLLHTATFPPPAPAAALEAIATGSHKLILSACLFCLSVIPQQLVCNPYKH